MTNRSTPIALNDLNKVNHPYLYLNDWQDIQNDPNLVRLSRLVGKYGVHIAFSPDIMVNLTGRALIEHLEHHTGAPSPDGHFANMLTGRRCTK